MSHRKGIEGPASFEAGLVKANADLRKAIRDTDKHAVQIEQRLASCIEHTHIHTELEKKNVNSNFNMSIIRAMQRKSYIITNHLSIYIYLRSTYFFQSFGHET